MKKKYLILSFLSVLTVLAGIGAARPHKALAAGLTGTWINIGTLEVDGVRYQEDNIDNNWHFYSINDPDGCTDEIDELDYNPDDQNQGPFALPKDTDVKLQKRKQTPSGCTDDGSKIDVKLSGNSAAKISFIWLDASTIEIPGEGTKFHLEDSKLFEKVGDNQCKDTLVPSADNKSLTLVVRVTRKVGSPSSPSRRNDLRSVYQGHTWVDQIDYDKEEGGGCVISKAISGLPMGMVADAAKPPGKGVSTSTGASSGSRSDSCESHGVMAWLFCPVIKMLDSAINWLDTQIQALLEVDKTSYDNPDLYAAWSQIRNFAYIILIPIMLVMVITTAMGSELFSAYTVKKALPRMAAAVLFITLSYFICTTLINLANVVGGGIAGIMNTPFNHLVPGGGRISQTGLSDLFGSSSAPLSFIIGKFIATASLAILGIILILFFFGSAILVFIGTAFMILLLRQLFIVALLLVAPLAILAWIFPGNDKLWKGWWSSFSKLLIMFPLIMALIAIGRDMAWLVNNDRGGSLQGALIAPIAKLALYVLPYAFIPATFKFAGGIFATVTGMAQDKGKGLSDRMRKKRALKFDRHVARPVVAKRADLQHRLQNAASNDNRGRLSKFALNRASGVVGGYNVQAQDSARRAAVAKEVNDQIATGRDDEIRGLTVNKVDADASDAARQTGTDAQGNAIWDRDVGHRSVLRRVNNNGVSQYKSLGGGWVNEGAVDAGHKRWGKDVYAQQAALSYEMRKAATEEEVGGIGERYATLATESGGHGGWAMTRTEASGALKGAGFENQNTHLEFKHMKTDGTMDYANFAKEAYEKKGSYPLAQMSSHTIAQLQNAYDNGDAETQQRVADVAEVFMSRYGGGGGMPGDPSDPATLVPTGGPGAAVGPAREVVQANTPGAASVSQAVRRLAVHTGRYGTMDPPLIGPAGPLPPDRLQR